MSERQSRTSRFFDFFASRFVLRENALWRVMKLLSPVKHWIIIANVFLFIASSLTAVGYVSLVPLAKATLSAKDGKPAMVSSGSGSDFLGQKIKWKWLNHQFQKTHHLTKGFITWMHESLPRYVMVFSLFLLTMVLLQGFFQFLGNWILAKATIEVCSDLLRNVYGNVLKQELQFFHNTTTGYLLKICYAEVFSLRDIMSFLASDRMMLPVQMGIFFVGLIAISPYLSFLLLFLLPIVILPMMFLNRKVKQSLNMEIEEEAQTMEVMSEGLHNILAIKAFGSEALEKQYVNPSIQQYVNITRKRRTAEALMGPVIDVLNMAVILAVFVAAIFVLSKLLKLEPSVLLAFMFMLQRFYKPFRSLMSMKIRMQRSSAIAGRIFRLLDRKPIIEEAPDAVEFPREWERLVARNVFLTYEVTRKKGPSFRPALQGVDFDIRRGEAVALVGHNGAGKSSIVNLICRLYDPNEGELCLDDLPVQKIKLESLHKKVCLITQHPILFNRSVSENIAYGLEGISQQEIEEAAKATGADAFVRNLPQGYETIIGEGGRSLSGGERQKIVLARAFVRKPEILILDEPTTGLDHQTTMEFLELVSKLRATRGTTIIYITHEPSHLSRFDRVLRLTEDKKVIEQPMEALA